MPAVGGIQRALAQPPVSGLLIVSIVVLFWVNHVSYCIILTLKLVNQKRNYNADYRYGMTKATELRAWGGCVINLASGMLGLALKQFSLWSQGGKYANSIYLL